MADEISATVVVKPKPFDFGHIFLIVVIDSSGKKLAYKRGWRPTSEWAVAAARRVSKRMVKNEERRAKGDRDHHINDFQIKP